MLPILNTSKEAVVATVLAAVSSIYFIIKNKRSKYPQDLTVLGPLWDDLLRLYDTWWSEVESNLKAQKLNYESVRLDTSSTMGPGSVTQVHLCGDRTRPVLLLLPGIRCSSCMWVDMIMTLTKHYYVVCLDYPFDVGRSVPGHDVRETVVTKGGVKYTKFQSQSKSPEEGIDNLISWYREILVQLEISQLSAAAGYSFGAYSIMALATKAPDLFKQKATLLLCAPPMAFSNMTIWVTLKIIILAIYYEKKAKLLAMKSYELEAQAGITKESDLNHKALDFFESLDKFGPYSGSLPDQPFRTSVFSADELKFLADNYNPTFLCPEWDVFFDAHIGRKRAEDAGIQTIFFEKTTHFITATQPERFKKVCYDVLCKA